MKKFLNFTIAALLLCTGAQAHATVYIPAVRPEAIQSCFSPSCSHKLQTTYPASLQAAHVIVRNLADVKATVREKASPLGSLQFRL